MEDNLSDQIIPQEKPEEKDLQPFTPSAEMKRWLETSFELGYGSRITDIAEAAKVSRQSWYNWLENDRFVKWWDTMWQKHLITMRWRLDAIGIKNSERNYDYWKDMMVRVGNMPAENKAPVVQNNIQVNPNNVDRLLEGIDG